MNYLICEDCDQKYCGWAKGITCQKCGGRLLRITREEFCSGAKETVIEEGGKK